MRQLEDGRLAVANAGTNELRFFDQTGEHVRTVGGEGDGPGEFRGMIRLSEPGNGELAVYDRAHRRLSVFNTEGVLVRTDEIGFPSFGGQTLFMDDVRLLDDGALVGMNGGDLSSGTAPSVTRDTASWFALFGGDSVQHLASMSGARTAHIRYKGRNLYRFAPMTPVPSWDASLGKIYVTSGEFHEVRVIDWESSTVSEIWRRPVPSAMADENAIKAWQEAYTTMLPIGDRTDLDEFFDVLPYPDRLPAYSAVHVDPEGYLWIEKYRPLWQPRGGEWEIYSLEGRYLGDMHLPEGLRVYEINRKNVVGVWTDELGVEKVLVFALSRLGVIARR